MKKFTVSGGVFLVVLLFGTVACAQAREVGQGKLNVNTATVQELQLLPRVGPALAQRIIDFRTANGVFKAPEELTRVKGIGETSFALLKPYVSIEGATTLKEKVKVPRAPKAAANKS